MNLQDVQPGDVLIRDVRSGVTRDLRVVKVTKRTPLRIFVGSEQFTLDGVGVSRGGGVFVRLPQESEVRVLESLGR